MAERQPSSAEEAQARLEQLNPSRSQPEKQDLHESRPAAPDQNWRRMQPIQITASPKRLDAPHQLTKVLNNSHVEQAAFGPKPQTHVVLDRFMVGHELRPGEVKELDMLASDIEYFMNQRREGRRDNLGRMLAKHPIRFTDIDEDRWQRESGHREAEDKRWRARWPSLSPEQAAFLQQFPAMHNILQQQLRPRDPEPERARSGPSAEEQREQAEQRRLEGQAGPGQRQERPEQRQGQQSSQQDRDKANKAKG